MRAAIVSHPLDAAALLAEVAAVGHGATAVFVGTVRDTHAGRHVTGMEYKAYEAMALHELTAVVAEAEAAYPGAQVVCEHRVGELTLGEASVVIAAAHAHRTPAFEACRFVIEELKRRVPIWKREHYMDGTRAWIDPTAPALPKAHA